MEIEPAMQRRQPSYGCRVENPNTDDPTLLLDGLCGAPVAEEEIDPGIHDRLGIDHSDGPGPDQPTPIDGFDGIPDRLGPLGATNTPLTGLPRLYRAAGLTVVLIDGWETRGGSNYGPWFGCLHHHTAGRISSRTLTPSLNICINGRTGLAGPLCNVYVGRDKKIYMVAAERANHSGIGDLPGIAANTGNGRLVGFEIENNGVGESWDYLKPTLDTLFAVTNDYLGVPRRNLWGHKEYALPAGRKSDPHPFSMGAERDRVAAWRPPGSVPNFIWGAWPLPDDHWFGEESSDSRCHSGYYERDREGVRDIQEGLKRRGWSGVEVTGRFSKEDGDRVEKFRAARAARLGRGRTVTKAVYRAIDKEPVQ